MLSIFRFCTYIQLFGYLLVGNRNRCVGVSNLNEHSSRSHSIFRMVTHSDSLQCTNWDILAAFFFPCDTLLCHHADFCIPGDWEHCGRGQTKWQEVIWGHQVHWLDSILCPCCLLFSIAHTFSPLYPHTRCNVVLPFAASEVTHDGSEKGSTITYLDIFLLRLSELNLVDLAGSETLTYEFGDKQQSETKHINLSLTMLKTVITALSKGTNKRLEQAS